MFQICSSNLNSKRFRNPFVANKYALESLENYLASETGYIPI
jgi:hypothetical protein